MDSPISDTVRNQLIGSALATFFVEVHIVHDDDLFLNCGVFREFVEEVIEVARKHLKNSLTELKRVKVCRADKWLKKPQGSWRRNESRLLSLRYLRRLAASWGAEKVNVVTVVDENNNQISSS